MTEMLERARANRVEALRLARERLSEPGARETLDAAHQIILSRFFRMFAGTEDMTTSKGHQPCIIVPTEEMREFRKTGPATHRWAEAEKNFLDLGDL